MAWSEKAIMTALTVYENRNPFLTRLDHHEALLAALDAAAAVDGDAQWNPIETAPKDHSVVLLYQPGSSGQAEAVGQGHRIDLREHAPDKWVFQATGWVCTPSHWMPLPKPPK